jgi:ASC-1-like (ASCH) protein
MPKIYESGRESSLLADIKAGTKTIEARLNRSKFALYKPGDHVWLREDFYKDSKHVRSVPRQVLVRVKKVEQYDDFKTMLETVGFKNVVPRAASLQGALDKCSKFYTTEQEKQYGVLAIYFEVLKISPK